MRIGDSVRLKTFNGTQQTEAGTNDAENYWKLIGALGTIQQDPREPSLHAGFSKEKRILVKFEINLENLGLVSHNIIPNSLWILAGDLEPIDT